jgi:hypothetical protein
MLKESEQLLAKEVAFSSRGAVAYSTRRENEAAAAVLSRQRGGRQRAARAIRSQAALDAAFGKRRASEFIGGDRNKPHCMSYVEHIIIQNSRRTKGGASRHR